MKELIEKLKTLAGEVKPMDLIHLMLTHKDGRILYFDGKNFIGWDANREVIVNATVADIVNVEWKGYHQTFGDYVRSKAQAPAAQAPAAQGLKDSDTRIKEEVKVTE